ncbi:MAG: hypothetical protein RIC56_01920 [Pseudomonadales bacterium]
MRIAILGNSGSGKSTLAQWLARRHGAPLLDLDSVAWEPGQIAVRRAAEAATREVRDFCELHRTWVLEGCYASLVEVALAFEPRLIFLNPGEAQCMENCRGRPWEPHKYPSKVEQDERLAFLLFWVADYYQRDGEMSLSGHATLFESYAGEKYELTARPELDDAAREPPAWST